MYKKIDAKDAGNILIKENDDYRFATPKEQQKLLKDFAEENDLNVKDYATLKKFNSELRIYEWSEENAT